MKQHTGMDTHDGYAPHSHEIRPDHRGVPRVEPAPAGIVAAEVPGYLTPEGHAAEAQRLLYVIDEELQDQNTPRSLLTLAVVALAHAMTAVAVDEYPPGEGPDEDPDGVAAMALYRKQNPHFDPDLTRNLMPEAEKVILGLGPENAGISSQLSDISSDTPSLSAAMQGIRLGSGPGTPTRFTPLHKQIEFCLGGPGVAPDGWTVRWLAQQTGHLDTEVLAELESMESDGLVRQSRPGYWNLPDTGKDG